MPRCLDSYPWRSLKGFGDMAPHVFQVGDFKNDVLTNGHEVQFRIIGFNHDRNAAGVVMPFTWEMVDCMPDRAAWNDRDTNQGSWEATKLRRQMNDRESRFWRLMPPEIALLAEPVIKLTANTVNGETTIIQTEDTFWIKSEKEMFGRCFFSAPGEGHWYEWYRQEDVPWHKMRLGEREYTMLRSPRYTDASNFCFVNTDGNATSDYASNSNGLAPAFSF